ncbi:MAG: hypothetical protein ACE5MI_02890 [Acidimicrobiia bacterium]
MGKTPFALPGRSGPKPKTNPWMPHLQLSDNAEDAVYRDLATWLFGLEHVEEGRSRVSLPSSRAAWISESYGPINPVAEREFTHIHTEPGPGSQHMGIPKQFADEILEKGWGEPHPMNEHVPDYELLMIYAPRNDEELAAIKTIIASAYHWALGTEPTEAA